MTKRPLFDEIAFFFVFRDFRDFWGEFPDHRLSGPFRKKVGNPPGPGLEP